MSVVSENHGGADAPPLCRLCYRLVTGEHARAGDGSAYCTGCATAILFGPPPPATAGLRDRLRALRLSEPEPDVTRFD